MQVSLGTAWSVDGYASGGKSNGSYQGVGEQSGLFAGEGGYHVEAGHVNLVGGAIASTNAGKSELSAQTLTFSDLQNEMEHKTSSGSISGGYAGGMDGWKPVMEGAAPSFGGGVPMNEKGGDNSTTYATLTEGNIVIGGKQTTAAELGVNTDAAAAHRALEALPNADKLLADQQIMAGAMGAVMSASKQIANDIGNQAMRNLENSYVAGLSDEDRARFEGLSSAEKAWVLKDKRSTEYQAAETHLKNWGVGSENGRALEAVTTLLVGVVSGQGGGTAVANALAPYAANLIGKKFDENHGSDPNAAAQLLSHALLGALLAEVNGGNAAGGAAAAAGGELAAKLLADRLYPGHVGELDEQQKQTILALSQAVAAVAGSSSADGLAGAALASGIAKNSVENNYLSHSERMEYLKEVKSCEDSGGENAGACSRATQLEYISSSRNDALRQACIDSASSACGVEIDSAMLALGSQFKGEGEYWSWLVANPVEMRGSEDNERAWMTHSTLADLVWKIDCARASANCGATGSTLLSLQGDPVTAARHESLRAIVEGAGKVGGVGGRAVDTVVGLFGFLKESMPIVQMGKSWDAIEYVNEFGLDAFLNAERAKSGAVLTGLVSGLKGYVKDAGGALGGKLTGGDYWDLYDVYRQGNIGGKVGFDALTSVLGVPEMAGIAKVVLAERRVAAAFRAARAEAAESTRVANAFYKDGAPLLFPQELKTSNGAIRANPDKSKTVLGSFRSDMESVINAQLGKSKSMVYDGAPQPGSFNVLNTPDALYNSLGPDVFWDKVNRPFLDSAIARGDDIVLASPPNYSVGGNIYNDKGQLTGYGRELKYLEEKGYVYDPVANRMFK